MRREGLKTHAGGMVEGHALGEDIRIHILPCLAARTVVLRLLIKLFSSGGDSVSLPASSHERAGDKDRHGGKRGCTLFSSQCLISFSLLQGLFNINVKEVQVNSLQDFLQILK